MNIVLVLTDGFFGLKQLRLKEVFVLLLILLLGGRLVIGLYLSVNDFINWKVGMLIFTILLLIYLLLFIESISLHYLGDFFVVIWIILYIMLQPYLHVLHPSIQITNLSYLLFFPLYVSHLKQKFAIVWLKLYLSA